MTDKVREYKDRGYKRLVNRMDEGRWVTTEGGHKVHIGENGQPDMGNPNVISKMSGGSASKPVDTKSFTFTNYRNPDAQGNPKYETYRKAMETTADETEKIADRAVNNYSGGMPPARQLEIEFRNLMGHSCFRDMVDSGAEQGLKDCEKAIYNRQKELIDQYKDYTNWDYVKRVWTNQAPKSEEYTFATKDGKILSREEACKKYARAFNGATNAKNTQIMKELDDLAKKMNGEFILRNETGYYMKGQKPLFAFKPNK